MWTSGRTQRNVLRGVTLSEWLTYQCIFCWLSVIDPGLCQVQLRAGLKKDKKLCLNCYKYDGSNDRLGIGWLWGGESAALDWPRLSVIQDPSGAAGDSDAFVMSKQKTVNCNASLGQGYNVKVTMVLSKDSARYPSSIVELCKNIAKKHRQLLQSSVRTDPRWGGVYCCQWVDLSLHTVSPLLPCSSFDNLRCLEGDVGMER